MIKLQKTSLCFYLTTIRLPHEAPEEPESWQTVVADIEEHIMPGITHW